MHRFYLPAPDCTGKELVLTGREAHHAVHVLRLKVGERLTVLDGAGHEILCETRATEKERLIASVVQNNFIPALTWQVTLLQAVPKGKTMETIIQKATELGAHRVVPLLSDRVVSQLDEEGAADRQVKWQQVAVEAIKQCGQPWLPVVDAPQTIKTWLDRNEKFELPLVASLQDGRKHPRLYFNDFRADRKRLPKNLCIWIGPEGDFTPAEMNTIRSSGALPITLGRLVLRSDTAAVYALSALSYEMQAE